ALPRPAPEPFAATVEEVEVGAERLGGMDVGGAGDVNRLCHLEAGPSLHLGAERGALGTVQLHHRQSLVLNRLRNLVQGGIDEHADDLALALESSSNLGRNPRIDVPGTAMKMDQPNSPSTEAHGLGRVIEIRDPTELHPHNQ